MMRLANGIVLDKDTTFGELKFSALRREAVSYTHLDVYKRQLFTQPRAFA